MSESIPLINRHEVERQTGLSTSAIYVKMRRGIFPRPIKVGERAVRWRQSEITAWIESRPRAGGESVAA